MIFIVNGVYKSGSTRLFSILLHLFEQEAVPEGLQSDHHSKNFDIVNNPLEVEKIGRDQHLVVKTHIYDKQQLARFKDSGYIILHTDRALPEILKSHRYHWSLERGFDEPVGWLRYSVQTGVFKAAEVCIYNYYASGLSDQIFRYEELSRTPLSAAKKINMEYRLGFTEDRLIAACDETDFTGADPSRFLGESTVRPWFTSRKKTTAGRFESKLAALTAHIGRYLALFLRTFKLDRAVIRRRHSYLRHAIDKKPG